MRIAFALLCFILLSSAALAQNVPVFLSIMSQCPDVKSYMIQVLNPVMASLGSIIDLQVSFIAKEDPSAKYGFRSMHGDDEVLGDLLEGCVQHASTNQTAFYDTLSCVTKDYKSLISVFPTCVTQHHSDLNVNSLLNCAHGNDGYRYMKEAVDLTNRLIARNSPTLYIGETKICEWNGAYCPIKSVVETQKAICNAYKGDNVPTLCKQF